MLQQVLLANKFTAKERDSESGLDYFGARYDSSALGRFMSPDEFTGGPIDAINPADPLPPGPLPYVDISNPQSLNKYAYTYNNPLRYSDPNGHCIFGLDTIVCVVAAAVAVVAASAYLLVKDLDNFNSRNKKREKEGGDSTLRCMDSNAICTESQMRGIHDSRTESIKDMGVEAIKNIPAGIPTTPTELVIDQVKDAAIDKVVEDAKRKAEDKRRQEEQRRAEEERRKKEEEERKRRCHKDDTTAC